MFAMHMMLARACASDREDVMKRLLITSAAIVIAGCAGAAQQGTELQQSDVTMNGATRTMIVVTGTDIPGHQGYTALGPVEGHCEKTPHGDGQIIEGDSFRQAAYRKYGDRVDAIVDATGWYVDNGASSVYEPHTSQGHFECGGTAVTFQPPAQ
jgi:hypothetical protein